jgi:hypothetical protein
VSDTDHFFNIKKEEEKKEKHRDKIQYVRKTLLFACSLSAN